MVIVKEDHCQDPDQQEHCTSTLYRGVMTTRPLVGARRWGLTFAVLSVSREPRAESRATSLCSQRRMVLRAPQWVRPTPHTSTLPATSTEYWPIRTHCTATGRAGVEVSALLG